MKTQLWVTLALLAAVTLPASADIYRWVDAQGRVHYSDKPVEGAQRVKGVDSRPTDPAAVAERSQAAHDQREKALADAQKKQTDQAAAKAVDKDTATVQADRCKKAQEDYRVAIESQRLYRVGKDGEREYLNDEELSTARINALKARDEACKKSD